jgi:hypothetical protein
MHTVVEKLPSLLSSFYAKCCRANSFTLAPYFALRSAGFSARKIKVFRFPSIGLLQCTKKQRARMPFFGAIQLTHHLGAKWYFEL